MKPIILNIKYVKKYHKSNKAYLEMSNGEKIPVSKDKKSDLLKYIKENYIKSLPKLIKYSGSLTVITYKELQESLNDLGNINIINGGEVSSFFMISKRSSVIPTFAPYLATNVFLSPCLPIK